MSLLKTKDDEIIEIIDSIFSKTSKNFNIEFWNNQSIVYCDNPKFIIKFRDKENTKQLIMNPDILSFAEAFINKTIDIEGDIFNAIKLKNDISQLEISNKDKLNLLFKVGSVNIHSKDKDKANIAFHYDISNDFYKLFLGETMMYSCAYFKTKNSNIDDAQKDKLDHICKKLMLKPNETLLDVGCGWGSMIIWASLNYGVKATGITISKEQYEYAKKQIKLNNLEDRCSVELKDYRDISGKHIYDKIVSIGMFEHVGLKKLPEYFRIIHRLLKDDGLFLNHGITTRKNNNLSKNEGKFITKYIFPGGELESISNVLTVMEDESYDIIDVECLRQHYYKTLKYWVENLKANEKEAIKLTNETIYRTWLLYMTGCAINFFEDYISVYQVLLCKKRKKGFVVPLTRDYIYN